MPARQDLAAVIPAAGRSSRMGAFKPLLPFGPHTIIEQVLATVRQTGIETIRVVVGWGAEQLIPVLNRRGVVWVLNEDHEKGMYASIQAGVRSLPAGVAAFFLLPGDMPRVRSATLSLLMAAWDERPGGIIYPCHEGRRGHPPLIASTYIPEILHEIPPGGLRTLLGRHVKDARNLEVGDPGILVDLDAPADYRQSLPQDPSA
jgi:CTP:molybdopterin cytidylyltransferase MocA